MTSRTAAPRSRPLRAIVPATESARDRFRSLDPYRAEREWKRYEGTPQRELFRALRQRFLARHPGPEGWSADLGSGPGRFTLEIGPPRARRVALDLSLEMLRRASGTDAAPFPAERVRGDASRPPLAPGRFGAVALLGNTLGFAGRAGEDLLAAAESLVAAGGRLLIEIAPAAGERSRYLARLPSSAVARLLRSPTAAVLPRVLREGFEEEPARRAEPGAFRRWTAEELAARWRTAGWTREETMAIAPALGPETQRLEAIRRDAKAWKHLQDLEEAIGRTPERWSRAAAVLLAASAPSEKRRIK